MRFSAPLPHGFHTILSHTSAYCLGVNLMKERVTVSLASQLLAAVDRAPGESRSEKIERLLKEALAGRTYQRWVRELEAFYGPGGAAASPQTSPGRDRERGSLEPVRAGRHCGPGPDARVPLAQPAAKQLVELLHGEVVDEELADLRDQDETFPGYPELMDQLDVAGEHQTQCVAGAQDDSGLRDARPSAAALC